MTESIRAAHERGKAVALRDVAQFIETSDEVATTLAMAIECGLSPEASAAEIVDYVGRVLRSTARTLEGATS